MLSDLIVEILAVPDTFNPVRVPSCVIAFALTVNATLVCVKPFAVMPTLTVAVLLKFKFPLARTNTPFANAATVFAAAFAVP